MVETDRNGGKYDRINRRSVLKGTVGAGLLTTGLSGIASADEWRKIEFCATSDEVFDYRIVVEEGGEVKRGTGTDSGDEVGDRTIDGACAKERCDDFRIKGEIVDHELNGPGEVFIDEKRVDLSGDGGRDGGDDGDLDKVADSNFGKQLRFDSLSSQVFSYEVTVGEKIRRESNRDGRDTLVNNTTARGKSADGNHDDWRFLGDIVRLELSGPGRVLVDGREIRNTTTDDDGGDGFEKEAIVTTEGDIFREYSFETTGRAENLEPDEDSGIADDTVTIRDDGSALVEGAVGTGDDRFAFNGTLNPINKPSEVTFDVRSR